MTNLALKGSFFLFFFANAESKQTKKPKWIKGKYLIGLLGEKQHLKCVTLIWDVFFSPLSVAFYLIPCSNRNLQNDHLGNVEQTLRGRETRFQVRQKGLNVNDRMVKERSIEMKTMGTQKIKGSGWDLKKIKRIETEAEQNKACEADMAARISCEPEQIKSYCKEGGKRTRNYEEGKMEEKNDDSRGL